MRTLTWDESDSHIIPCKCLPDILSSSASLVLHHLFLGLRRQYSIFNQNESLKYHARPLNILKLGLTLGSYIITVHHTTSENPGIHRAQPACFANLARLQPHPVPHNLEGILCCRIHGVSGSECSSVGDHRKFGRFRFCHAKMRLLKRQTPQGTMALHSGIKWGGFLDEIQRAGMEPIWCNQV